MLIFFGAFGDGYLLLDSYILDIYILDISACCMVVVSSSGTLDPDDLFLVQRIVDFGVLIFVFCLLPVVLKKRLDIIKRFFSLLGFGVRFGNVFQP